MGNVVIKAKRKLNLAQLIAELETHDERRLSQLCYRVVRDKSLTPEQIAAADAEILEINKRKFGPDFPPGEFPDWMYGKKGRPKDG